MSVSLSPIGGAASQFFNGNGIPLSGGKMYTYDAGTTTPKATFTSSLGLTSHSNPIILDSSGRVPSGEIWLTTGQAYKFVLNGSNDVLIGTWDNIYGYSAGVETAVTEVVVATAGQTDFVLTSMIYTPGTNTLGVYIDGVNQVVNNSYTEVSATLVTFVSGLHVGAVVKFIQINSAATSSDLVSYQPAGTGAVATTVQTKLRESVSVLDFGADPTGVSFSDLAFTNAVAASNHIYVPSGTYKFSATHTINNKNGLIIEGDGAALVSRGVRYTNNTILNFDSAASGTNGLVITNCVGLVLKNLLVSHLHSGVGGGSAILLSGVHDFTIDNIKVDSYTAGKGLVLGGGTGATANFQGSIKNVKVLIDGGDAIRSDTTNTSLTFESCYQIGGTFSFIGTTYSTLNSLASESAPFYGYAFDNCNGMTVNACGGEVNGRGLVYMSTNTRNMVFNSPVGISNNTVNGAAWGELFEIDSSVGACKNITINNPSSINPAALTLCGIRGTSGTGRVYINGADAANLPKGVGGDPTWLLYNALITGDLQKVPFFPTLAVGWTLVGVPTISAYYYRVGKIVNFSITITPGTSLKANAGDSINLPWFIDVGTGLNVVDGNAAGYVSATAASTSIYMPMTPVLTVPLTISGQLFTI